MAEIINRVASSTLLTIDIDLYLDQAERVALDVRQFLFEGIMLREKEFRASVKQHDWSFYKDKTVRVFCSEDTIIPVWAYMIVLTKLKSANFAAVVDEQMMELKLVDLAIEKITQLPLSGAKVVIKGCGDLKLRDYAYSELTRVITPIVSSIMYGEPCSTVPVYKKA